MFYRYNLPDDGPLCNVTVPYLNNTTCHIDCGYVVCPHTVSGPYTRLQSALVYPLYLDLGYTCTHLYVLHLCSDEGPRYQVCLPVALSGDWWQVCQTGLTVELDLCLHYIHCITLVRRMRSIVFSNQWQGRRKHGRQNSWGSCASLWVVWWFPDPVPSSGSMCTLSGSRTRSTTPSLTVSITGVRPVWPWVLLE